MKFLEPHSSSCNVLEVFTRVSLIVCSLNILGDRGHVIEKSRNTKTDTEEQKQDFFGIDEGIFIVCHLGPSDPLHLWFTTTFPVSSN